MYNKNRQRQAGGVSIFIVVFSALLVTIVTISFVSVMIRTQQQSTNADLSNSAYDSALAGVEDAKRLLLMYRECQRNGDTTSADCSRIISSVNSGECNTVKRGLYKVESAEEPGSEVLVQRQQSGDDASKDLNQAYTCVTVDYTSSDLKGSLSDGESRLIPIETDASTGFTKIKLSWFKKPQGATSGALNLPTAVTFPRHTSTSWPSERPSVMRTQLVQVGNTFSADQFDQDSSNQSNTNTLYLHPFGAGLSAISYPYTSDNRTDVNSPKNPYPIRCDAARYNGNDYACSATIDIPDPVGGSRKNFYLQLGAFYNAADFKIELLNDAGGGVDIVGPVVDSTGRANDLFRRVEARIDFAGEYARAGIDIEGDLCKDFSVTDKDTDFVSNSCTP